MAIAKVVFNGDTLMDVTQKTVTAGSMLSGTTALKNDGTDITGNYAPSVSSLTVTPTTSQQVFDGVIVGSQVAYIYATSSSKTKTISPSLTVGATYYFVYQYGSESASMNNTLSQSTGTFTCSTSAVTPISPLTITASQVQFNGTQDVFTLTIYEATVLDGYLPVTVDGYIPKLQNKEITMGETAETIATDNLLAYYNYAHPCTSYASGYSIVCTFTKLNTPSNNKNYILQGKLFIRDNNDDILESFDIIHYPTLDQTTYIDNISSTYIKDSRIYFSTSSIQFLCRTKAAYTIGVTLQANIIEDNTEYEGLSYVKVNLNPNYGLYKCLMQRDTSLNASGISSYGFTATDVSNWCNSFSNSISNNQYNTGNVTYRQFEGINFNGSFYFNNLIWISNYTFARAWTGNGNSDIAQAELYFPEVILIGGYAFASNGNIKYIEASNCTSLYGSAFYRCNKLTEINFPKCEIISGNGVFYFCSGLTSLNFPECSIVGSYAFYQCYKISSINFPKCTILSFGAFTYCSSLTTISFPLCTTIGSQAFLGCSKLNNISFPECEVIYNGAFQNCSLTNIYFPKCSYISQNAFYACSQLTTVSFPECNILGYQAFAHCSQLSDVSLPKCTTIDSYAFYNCTTLSSINLPSVTVISSAAFSSCSALTTISFSECTTISDSVFYNCSNLTTVDLPKCTTIPQTTFARCTSLSTLSLPACTDIGANAFQSCYNLLSLYLMGSSYVSLATTNAFNYTPISTYTTSTGGVNGSIYVPSSMLDTYKTMTNWITYSSRFVGI